LKEITISGFRGYAETPETLDLSLPAVLFMGGNRSGKSSTLNAIEWALYGDEVAGAGKVGIDERKGWLVKNRQASRVRVELVLYSDAGEVRVVRETVKGRKKGGTFSCTDENGNRHSDEAFLWNRLGLGPRDFMSSVYLHQEVIRDIVVTSPRVRKEALDRLLGISHLRNLFEAIKSVKIGSIEEKISSVYERLEYQVETKAQTYRETLNAEMERGEELGLAGDSFTQERLESGCLELLEHLHDLEKQAGTGPCGTQAPASPGGHDSFVREVRQVINRLRADHPGMRSQKALDEQRSGLDGAVSRFRIKKAALLALKQEKKEIENGSGTMEVIREKIQTIQQDQHDLARELAGINDRINVVDETIRYLETLEDRQKTTPCPACRQEIVPENLLADLVEMKAGTREETEALEARKQENRRLLKGLKEAEQRLGEIVREEIPGAETARDEALHSLEELLGRALQKEEDPEVAVDRRIREIAAEMENNKQVLERYLQGVSALEKIMEALTCIIRVLAYQERIRKLNAVRQSAPWLELDRKRDEVNEELGRVQTVQEVVESVLREKSQEKILETRGRIREMYRKLVNRPDFEWIEIDPESYDVYAVTDGNRDKLLTFFNQGDMNCAALTLFLALGSAGSEAGTGASFFLFDDPSQSLDPEQKRRFVSLLEEVAEHRQILLATMDPELFEQARSGISRKKKVYTFGRWDPDRGPSISEA